MNEKSLKIDKRDKESLLEFLKNSPLDEILPFLERRDDLTYRDTDFLELPAVDDDTSTDQNREQ